MFLHFKNGNTIHCKKSLYSIVVKTKINVVEMSSVHSSSVLTVKAEPYITKPYFSKNEFFSNKFLKFIQGKLKNIINDSKVGFWGF